MRGPTLRLAARAIVAVGVSSALLASCSSSGDDGTPFPTPLSTKGTDVDLLCGFVPRASVVTALGRSDFTVSGAVVKAGARNPDGTDLASARCAVSVPDGGESPAFSVTIKRFVPGQGDEGIIRAARSGAEDFTYPGNIGVGFAGHDNYHDATGKSHVTCESGLLRGDWTITLGIEMPAQGRVVLDDTVALAQEMIDILKLPLKPTKPYPDVSNGPANRQPTSLPSS